MWKEKQQLPTSAVRKCLNSSFVAGGVFLALLVSPGCTNLLLMKVLQEWTQLTFSFWKFSTSSNIQHKKPETENNPQTKSCQSRIQNSNYPRKLCSLETVVQHSM